MNKIYCSVCKKLKSVSSFYPIRIRKNKNGWCKNCINITRRKRYSLISKKIKRKYNPIIEKKHFLSQYKKFKYKFIARQKVKIALKNGLLEKKPCKICSSFPSEAHHPNYFKPLEVVWLCDLHHKKLHGQFLGF